MDHQHWCEKCHSPARSDWLGKLVVCGITRSVSGAQCRTKASSHLSRRPLHENQLWNLLASLYANDEPLPVFFSTSPMFQRWPWKLMRALHTSFTHIASGGLGSKKTSVYRQDHLKCLARVYTLSYVLYHLCIPSAVSSSSLPVVHLLSHVNIQTDWYVMRKPSPLKTVYGVTPHCFLFCIKCCITVRHCPKSQHVKKNSRRACILVCFECARFGMARDNVIGVPEAVLTASYIYPSKTYSMGYERMTLLQNSLTLLFSSLLSLFLSLERVGLSPS